ncbi:pentapeptide repeat-containing protein, partial [bacterium]|nr:pentapeptide repeat-containing protein [bacterium]
MSDTWVIWYGLTRPSLLNTRRNSAQLCSTLELNSVELSSAQLSAAQLRSAQLSSAQLSSAQLSLAQLGSARLSSAQLGSTDRCTHSVSRSFSRPSCESTC